MPYAPQTWVDNTTPVDATHLNHMEAGIATADANAASALAAALPAVVNGKWVKGVGGAAVWTSIAAADIAGYPADGTKFLAGDGTWKAAGGLSYRKTTPKVVNTTVAATDLLNGEIAIAAGVMGATGLLRLTAWGDYKQNSGAGTAAPRFQLILGATTLFDTGALAAGLVNIATRYPWRVQAEILNTAAGAQVASFSVRGQAAPTNAGSAAAFTTGEGLYQTLASAAFTELAAIGYATSAENTALARNLILNIINPSASALWETVLAGALVEII